MNGQTRRLPTGGYIDRTESINFYFNGKKYQGFKGDTLASALLANNVVLTGRSFKYHRPRGVVSAGLEEPGSIVELMDEQSAGNQPATTVKLHEGLAAKSVNCWPSLEYDLMSVNQLFAPLLPAAFYYKTFKWPNWHWFEPGIRKAAGLASMPVTPSIEDRHETRYTTTDTLVIGAGPAGIMAALAAARTQTRVMLIDNENSVGGSLRASTARIENHSADEWIATRVAELDQNPNIVRLCNTTAWAYREHNLVIATELPTQCTAIKRTAINNRAGTQVISRTWKIRSKRVVIATGAIERMLVFANNDRPGIMLASAVATYINQYAVIPGSTAVIFTTNSSAYAVAKDLVNAGIDLKGIVDSREFISDTERGLVPGVDIYTSHQVSQAIGHKRVSKVKIRAVDATGSLCGPEKTLTCDLLCLSGGWSPTVHLYSQSRGTLRYDQELAAFLPDQPIQNTVCAGSAAGVFELNKVILDGSVKGSLDKGSLDTAESAHTHHNINTDNGARVPYTISPVWHVETDHPTKKAFVDLNNDVTTNDIALAIREGFSAVEHVKRYTTAGMGLDQGRTGNVNVIGIVANLTDTDLESVGTTTFRSPFSPISFGSIAGHRTGDSVLPYRHTPITQWHKEAGATMYESGARWRRPGLYPVTGESFQQTVDREVRAVHTAVGVYDGSPLGKFELKGADTTKFLNMLYTCRFDNLISGMGRYGIMLTEDGLIFDDGVSFKLSDNHYLMSTSTAHADEVNRHMEQFLAFEEPQWKVAITPVTSQWCNATLCGPLARDVVQQLDIDIDLSPTNFPFMAIRNCLIGGIPARICRVSFTGELSFEINVQSRYFARLWQDIMAAGKPYNIQPIGSEANHVLRVEKGFLSLGHEADGTTDPFDLGMQWIMSKDKSDFIGKRAVNIRQSGPGVRRQLVGLTPDDSGKWLLEGAPLTPGGIRAATEGIVTACVWSEINNRIIALALLDNGHARTGEIAYVRQKEEVIPVTICAPCFHDSTGKLLRS